MTQNNLGTAYVRLAEVRDREGNLERAIAAYREALRFRTPETAPLEYATTQNNLGNAYVSWRRFGIGRGTWSGRLPPTGRRCASAPRRPPRWTMR
jgi:tetratricopeptide (TPR) repeat protein